jgi:hypothetical protein
MNLKILAFILIYYTAISLFFLTMGSSFVGASYHDPLNSSEMQSNEISTGGVFSGGISFTRFIGLVTIGVGMPDGTPTALRVMVTAWQSGFLIFTIGFIISSIWNG